MSTSDLDVVIAADMLLAGLKSWGKAELESDPTVEMLHAVSYLLLVLAAAFEGVTDVESLSQFAHNAITQAVTNTGNDVLERTRGKKRN